MSLVNKIITDLEDRQILSTKHVAKEFHGLTSADYENRGHRFLSVRLLSFILFFITSVSATYALMGNRPEIMDQDLVANVKQESKSPEGLMIHTDETEIGFANEALQSSPLKLDFFLSTYSNIGGKDSLTPGSKAIYEGFSTIENIRLNNREDLVLLNLTLSSEVDYRAYTLTNPDRVVVQLDNAVFEGVLPALDGSNGISNIRLIEDPVGDFKLVIDTVGSYEIDNLELLPSRQGYNLSLSLKSGQSADLIVNNFTEPGLSESTSAAPSEIAEFGEMTKNRSQGDDLQQIGRMYSKAEELYRSGNSGQANKVLYDLLEINPGHKSARSLLASKLIAQGQLEKAEAILSQGLGIHGKEADWANLSARLRVNRGEISSAIDILTRALPDVFDDPEYYAFLAALYQKNQQHESAINTYKQVLEINPANSVWWMGLAISLEALQKNADALFAYKKALHGRQMSPDLQKYVHGKISHLSKRG